jgi:transposase
MNTDVPFRSTPSPANDPANDPDPAASATTTPTSFPNEPRLPDDPDVLKRMIAELLDALKKANHERDGVQHRLDLLLRRLYGPKAERFDPNQPWLLPEMAEGAAQPGVTESSSADSADSADAPEPAIAEDDAASADPSKTKRPGHGRKKLPADLPRRRIEHTLPEADRLCPCCGDVCKKFGEEVREQLDYQPASLFVQQHVRFKYACSKCHDHVTAAPPPPAVIDKGLPGSGLLAQIVASKYADHLPLHRLERILGRHGVELSRSTTCGWMSVVARHLSPVVQLMADLVRQSHVVHTDATRMPYLDETVKGKTVSGQMWIYVGDRDHPFDVFDFCRDHSAVGIDAFLRDKDYRGLLCADALNLYDHLFAGGVVGEVGCWAHCRRNFFEAKESDPARAHLVLARVRQLYDVEKKAKKLIADLESQRSRANGIATKLPDAEADEIRRRLRQEESLPSVTALRHWLIEEQPKVLPKSLMGGAIAYALRHWQALTRYLEDGRLDIDNNVAERTLRHIAIGRKNWMFAGSAAGAETAAILFSVTSSCHRHGVDAFAYVRDILDRLIHDPHPSAEELRAWLPDRWRPPPSPESTSSSATTANLT